MGLLLLTFVSIAKYFLLGYASLTLLRKARIWSITTPPLLSIPLALLLGILVASIILHLGLVLNLMIPALILVWLLTLLSIIILVRNNIELPKLSEITDPGFVTIIIGYLLQCFTLIAQPVMANDARAIWLLKARAIFESVPSFFTYLQSTTFAYSHTDYPLTMPLLYVDILKPLGTFWEPAIAIFSVTFFFALIIGVYGALKHYIKLPQFVLLLLVLVVFFTPEYIRQGWSGLSDVPLSLAFFGVTAIFLFRDTSKNLLSGLLPAILIAALGATIKNEGQTFVLFTVLLAAGILVFDYKKKSTKYSFKELLPYLASVLLAILPLGLWKIVQLNYHITNDIASSPNLRDIITRVPTLLSETLPRLFDGYRFGILWVSSQLLWLTFAFAGVIRKNTTLPTLLILVQASTYIAIYLITPHDLVWHISTSFSRLVLHLLPSVYLLAIATAPSWQGILPISQNTKLSPEK